MNSIITSEDRRKAVEIFLTARLRHEAWIEDYSNIIEHYLNKPDFEPLRPINHTRATYDYDRLYVSESDAEAYVNDLIDIITGVNKKDIDSTKIAVATDQLFGFLQVLGSDLHLSPDVKLIAIPDFERRFQQLSSKLEAQSRTIQARDKEIASTFQLILDWKKEWQKEYEQTLKYAKEYFAGKVSKP